NRSTPKVSRVSRCLLQAQVALLQVLALWKRCWWQLPLIEGRHMTRLDRTRFQVPINQRLKKANLAPNHQLLGLGAMWPVVNHRAVALWRKASSQWPNQEAKTRRMYSNRRRRQPQL